MQVAAELGPDTLCTQLDEARALLSEPDASNCSVAGGGGLAAEESAAAEVALARAAVARLRELVHVRLAQLRTGSLARLAAAALPKACAAVRARVLGPDGLLTAARAVIARGDGGEEGLRAVSRALRACRVCARLGLLPPRRALEDAAGELAGFLSAHAPSDRAAALAWRATQRDAAAADATAETDGHTAAAPARRRLADDLALRGLAASTAAASSWASACMVRVTVEAKFEPAAAEVLRSGILCLLVSQVPGARLRAVRVEPADGAACAAGRGSGDGCDRTLVDVAIERSPRSAEVDGRRLAATFTDLTTQFSVVARGSYGVSAVTVLAGCVFLSLSLASLPSTDTGNGGDGDDENDVSPGSGPGGGGMVDEDEEDILASARRRASRRLRADLAEALELPRTTVRVVRAGACGLRAVVELAAAEGQVSGQRPPVPGPSIRLT